MSWEDLSLGEQVVCIVCPIVVAGLLLLIIFLIYRARRKAELEGIDALIYSGEVNRMNTVMDYLRRQRMQQILDGEDSYETDVEDQASPGSLKKKKSKQKKRRKKEQQQVQAPTLIMVNPTSSHNLSPVMGPFGVSQSVPPMPNLHQPPMATPDFHYPQEHFHNVSTPFAPNRPYVAIDVGDGLRTHAVEPLPEARIRLARDTQEYPPGPVPMAPPGYKTVPIIIEKAHR